MKIKVNFGDMLRDSRLQFEEAVVAPLTKDLAGINMPPTFRDLNKIRKMIPKLKTYGPYFLRYREQLQYIEDYLIQEDKNGS